MTELHATKSTTTTDTTASEYENNSNQTRDLNINKLTIDTEESSKSSSSTASCSSSSSKEKITIIKDKKIKKEEFCKNVAASDEKPSHQDDLFDNECVSSVTAVSQKSEDFNDKHEVNSNKENMILTEENSSSATNAATNNLVTENKISTTAFEGADSASEYDSNDAENECIIEGFSFLTFRTETELNVKKLFFIFYK